ncbi:unnamed protein product [Rotaria sp. Silwood2]|nr:unnamed protein product [Rotaria sp. Silwood2]CAF2609520.1 unnamed protein product [Rotaria sp. Silwood2]CAF2850771.1 unnamed protein product [Rotaria sp. Silwood2]CAF3023278.1 unnamed protein product [Rotaria sp. Silwood2]CAF3899537.1 unnamed protein product [Rotaria sp. Silwood2]
MWDQIINTDFSGKFTLESYSNSHSESIWATDADEISPAYRNRSKNKFASSVIFWDGISYNSLAPKNGPIDATLWLQKQVKDKQKKRNYMNGQLYDKFIKEIAYEKIQNVC